jgi:imidazolonepropionase-like amidohydrolase
MGRRVNENVDPSAHGVQQPISSRIGSVQGPLWHSRRGAIMFGTDVGYMGDYDPADEYALMAEAGMTTSDILASLTTTPAERFGASSRVGRLAPGLAADIVVLGADPSRDVRAFADVRYTIRDGRVIYSKARP